MEKYFRTNISLFIQGSGCAMSVAGVAGDLAGVLTGTTAERAAPAVEASESYDSQRSAIIQERARKFIADRRRERGDACGERSTAIGDKNVNSSTNDSGTYGAVSRFRKDATRVRCLSSGDLSEPIDLGTLRSMGDSRYKLNTETVDYKNKKVISMSCNRITMTCLVRSCGGSRGGGGASGHCCV
jgi:hypothetical protein